MMIMMMILYLQPAAVVVSDRLTYMAAVTAALDTNIARFIRIMSDDARAAETGDVRRDAD